MAEGEHLETAVGVFNSRERAEHALEYLLENGVPEDAIVYLTRSETEAVILGKEIGGFAGGIAGGAVGFGAGMVAASLALIPGMGEVFALGAGAAALLALLGKKAGAAAGAKLAKDIDADVLRDEQSAARRGSFPEYFKKRPLADRGPNGVALSRGNCLRHARPHGNQRHGAAAPEPILQRKCVRLRGPRATASRCWKCTEESCWAKATSYFATPSRIC